MGDVKGKKGEEEISLAQGEFGVETVQSGQNEVQKEQERTTRKKAEFLSIYSTQLITITKACSLALISRQLYYDWLSEDPEFKEDVLEAEKMQHDLVEGILLDMTTAKDGPSVRYWLDRRSPIYKPKTVLEHHVGARTLEDLIDEEKAKEDAKNAIGVDRGAVEDPQQEEGDRPVQAQRSPEVLLGSEDAPQHHSEGAAEGTDEDH